MRARSKEIYRRMKVLLLLSENSISPEYTLWGDNRQGSFWLTMLYCKQVSYAPSSHHVPMIEVVSHDCMFVEMLDNVWACGCLREIAPRAGSSRPQAHRGLSRRLHSATRRNR